MSQYWQCPLCKTRGKYLFNIGKIVTRSMVDPALDKVQCFACAQQFKRYDGLVEEKPA
jgi:hypothetical protein